MRSSSSNSHESSPPLRLLNLVLYSPSAYYDEMREALRAHHARNCGADRAAVVVRHLFYWYDESLLAPFELRGADELVLRGRESFLPGILHKTVRAIELATSGALGADCADVDYVVRTNVSSVCDFQGIARALRKAARDDGGGGDGDNKDDGDNIFYGGPCVYALNWRHNEGGITDDRLAGLIFAQGTCIAISSAACRLLVREQREIDWTVIDDVALAVFFRDRGGVCKLDGTRVFSKGATIVPGALVYRHATHHALGEESRLTQDVPNMRALVAAWPLPSSSQLVDESDDDATATTAGGKLQNNNACAIRQDRRRRCCSSEL